MDRKRRGLYPRGLIAGVENLLRAIAVLVKLRFTLTGV